MLSFCMVSQHPQKFIWEFSILEPSAKICPAKISHYMILVLDQVFECVSLLISMTTNTASAGKKNSAAAADNEMIIGRVRSRPVVEDATILL